MPQPNQFHRQMERMAGSWLGEEKMCPSPWDPEGGTAIGRIENRIALDSIVLIQDYEQEPDGTVVYRGHGVLRWDAAGER